MKPSEVATLPRPHFQPIPVFVGPAPGWTGPIAHAVGDTATATKQAYANDKGEGAESPLKPAPDAQSMRGKRGKRHGHAAKHRGRRGHASRAAHVRHKSHVSGKARAAASKRGGKAKLATAKPPARPAGLTPKKKR